MMYSLKTAANIAGRIWKLLRTNRAIDSEMEFDLGMMYVSLIAEAVQFEMEFAVCNLRLFAETNCEELQSIVARKA